MKLGSKKKVIRDQVEWLKMIKINFIRDDLEKEEEKVLKVEEGEKVDQFLKDQGVEREEVLVAKNGTIISGQHQIEDGDEIKVMDVIAGG